MITINDAQKKLLRSRQLAIQDLYARLRFYEHDLGYVGVLAGIKKWLNNPKRGAFK